MLAGNMVPLYHLNNCSQYFCDNFYQNNSGIYYTLRGGSCTYGRGCGTFSVLSNATVSTAHWYRGASLSFKLLFLIIYYSSRIL